MVERVIAALLVCTALGGWAVRRVAGNDVDNARQHWTKYLVYLALVVIWVTAILLDGAVYLAGGMVLAGFLEFIHATVNNKPSVFKAIPMLLLFGLASSWLVDFVSHAPVDYILTVYTMVVVMDAFSQLSGQLFGRHRISNISPNKTWEGLVGGYLATCVAFFVMTWKLDVARGLKPVYEMDARLFWNGLAFALLLCLFSFAGDMTASWYKRVCGIKDYSSLLKGQGGVLDRYDSLLAMGMFYQCAVYLDLCPHFPS